MSNEEDSAQEMIRYIWSEIENHGLGHLDRVHAYLSNMLTGSKAPSNSGDREVFRFLFFPGLRPGPYFNSENISGKLNSYELKLIRKEAQSALENAALLIDHSDMVVPMRASEKPKWDCVYFRREFFDIPTAHRAFPVTAKFLAMHRLATEALFSRLASYSHIEPHSDRANYVTTVHVPLANSGASLTVAGIAKSYHAGRTIVFDSSFIHSVDNSTEFPRDILLFNVWHPDLSDEEIKGIKLVRQYWNSSMLFDPNEGFA